MAVVTPSIPIKPSRPSKLREFIGLLTSSKTAFLGFLIVAFWVIVALFADDLLIRPDCWTNAECKRTQLISRFDPNQQIRGIGWQKPDWLDEKKRASGEIKHVLGTDKRNRDIWSRIAHGSRIVLTLAPLSVAIALLIGGFLGLVAGYFGGLVDEIVMRILDIMMAFPQILLYLVILAALGPSVLNIVIAIVLAGAPGIARLVRSLTLDIKTRDYIAAAQTRGESPWYIMFVEILPNARGPILIDAMLRVGYTVFAISTLGFLGLGLPPPSPDWGSIVNVGRTGIQAGQFWEALSASLATASLVVGLNLMADGLQEQMNKYR